MPPRMPTDEPPQGAGSAATPSVARPSGAGSSDGPSDASADAGVVLMLAWRAGDERAFERLVELYSGQLWALFTRFLGAHPRREDLVQEVFLRLIRARERYEPSARFSTYLYRIAFNLAVNETQRPSRQPRLRLAGGDDEDSATPEIADLGALPPSEGLERDDVVRAVRAAIAQLPETQRMALVLAKYHELPYAEIAVVLDSSEKAIKSLIHRARESLRRTLAPFLEEELA